MAECKLPKLDTGVRFPSPAIYFERSEKEIAVFNIANSPADCLQSKRGIECRKRPGPRLRVVAEAWLTGRAR